MTAHLAQLNVGRMIAAKGDPRVADFVAALDRVNAIADGSPGFVWRLVDEGGLDATELRPFGPDIMVNMSVWESLDELRIFTFRSGHLDILRRRREWFAPLGEAHAVAWWVPVGHIPSLTEAGDRLKLLRSAGPTVEAFTLRDPFPAP